MKKWQKRANYIVFKFIYPILACRWNIQACFYVTGSVLFFLLLLLIGIVTNFYSNNTSCSLKPFLWSYWYIWWTGTRKFIKFTSIYLGTVRTNRHKTTAAVFHTILIGEIKSSSRHVPPHWPKQFCALMPWTFGIMLYTWVESSIDRQMSIFIF